MPTGPHKAIARRVKDKTKEDENWARAVYCGLKNAENWTDSASTGITQAAFWAHQIKEVLPVNVQCHPDLIPQLQQKMQCAEAKEKFRELMLDPGLKALKDRIREEHDSYLADRFVDTPEFYPDGTVQWPVKAADFTPVLDMLLDKVSRADKRTVSQAILRLFGGTYEQRAGETINKYLARVVKESIWTSKLTPCPAPDGYMVTLQLVAGVRSVFRDFLFNSEHIDLTPHDPDKGWSHPDNKWDREKILDLLLEYESTNHCKQQDRTSKGTTSRDFMPSRNHGYQPPSAGRQNMNNRGASSRSRYPSRNFGSNQGSRRHMVASVLYRADLGGFGLGGPQGDIP